MRSILATGAPHDRKLGIPGEDLPGVVGSAEFVGWYNGHPDFAGLDPPLGGSGAVVVGNGNVALDCARILSKTRDEFEGSDIVGHALDALDQFGDPDRHHPRPARAAPDRHDSQGTGRARPSRSGGRRSSIQPISRRVEADEALDPACANRSRILRGFADSPTDKPKRMVFDFFARPVRIEGDGKVERVIVERTELDEKGGARGTGETYEVPASLVISAIGYSTSPIDGVPFEGGKFVNDGGRIADRLYAVGWARRGPSGTIGTNRPDGYEVAEQIAAAHARRKQRKP